MLQGILSLQSIGGEGPDLMLRDRRESSQKPRTENDENESKYASEMRCD